MKQRLDVGETLHEVFSTYGELAGVLLPVAFWIFLFVAAVNGLIAGNLALFPLALAVSVIAETLYQGIVVTLVRDARAGRQRSIGEIVGSVAPVIPTLIGAGVLSGLAVGIGFFLLIVPALILLTIWAVIAPVIVVERSGVTGAFGRSRELVSGNGWPVFGAIFVALMVTFIAALLLGAIGSSIAHGVIVEIVFSAVASTITAPIGALVAAVLYFRLLAINKAVEASADQGEPPPASAAPSPD